MGRTAIFLIFIAVGTLLWGSIHYYVGARLFRPWRASAKVKRFAKAAFWFGFALTPLTLFGSRLFSGGAPEVLVWPGLVHMGFFFLLFCFTVFRDLGLLGVRGLARLGKRPISEDRRAFLTRSTNAGVLGLTSAVGGFGVYEALSDPELVEVDVPITGLPAALDGYRIAQISDVHVGPTIKRGFVEHLVSRINTLDVDMVAVTGDLVDGQVDVLRPHTSAFSELRGKDGVYFCTGNHEYYSGALEWIEEVRRYGWIPLINEHRLVERDGFRLLIAGCTDHTAERVLPEHKTDPVGSKAGAPSHDASVLLAHQPRSIHAAAEAGFDLQLSGHTHGGQFFPVTLFVDLAHPFGIGLNQEDQTWIYVNRGTGYWGPPIRAGVPSEITLLRLVRA